MRRIITLILFAMVCLFILICALVAGAQEKENLNPKEAKYVQTEEKIPKSNNSFIKKIYLINVMKWGNGGNTGALIIDTKSAINLWVLVPNKPNCNMIILKYEPAIITGEHINITGGPILNWNENDHKLYPGLTITPKIKYGKFSGLFGTDYLPNKNEIFVPNWRILYDISGNVKLGPYYAFTTNKFSPTYGSRGAIIEVTMSKNTVVKLRYGETFGLPKNGPEVRIDWIISP